MTVITTFESVVTDIRLESRRPASTAIWWMSLDPHRIHPSATTGFLEAVTRSGTRLEIPVTNCHRRTPKASHGT